MENKKRIWLMLVALLLMTGTFMGYEGKIQAASSPVSICAEEEWEVLKIVNQERIKQGLMPLSTYSALQKAGDTRAIEIGTKFSHTRPNGSSCFSALREAGVTYNFAGENIAAGQQSAAEVMTAWMNSPGHKANILTSEYSHIGIGYSYQANSVYRKHWVQMFTGTCNPTSISVKSSDTTKSYSLNTTIEGMNRVLVIKCQHGTAYMPVLTEMCSGYKIKTTGTQTIKVKYGEKTTQFQVNITGNESTKANIKNATISNIKNKTYTGKNITQSPKIVFKGTALKKNTDYTLSYKNNKNAGKATITIKGKGKYTGTVKKTYTIKKCPMKNVTVNKIRNQAYTGKSIKPKITIKYKGIALNKKYYTITYRNNKKAGTGKITLKGKGNFTGTITKTFKIVKK